MATPAAILQVLVTANTAQATASLTKFNSQMKGTTVQASRTSSATSKMGAAAGLAGKVIAGGLVYGLYKGVKAGVDFEKQMDAVGAVANANAKEMKELNKQALKLGQSTIFSASEVAEAQGELAKGGLKVSQILGGALPAALKLAAAGQLDLGDAASTTVNAMQLFQLKAKDATKVADMLATAANTTTADVSDFAMALRQGGSVAKQAGLDMNETVTVLEALAEAGIKNSDAGTSMKTAFLQLLAPTEKQKDLMAQLNLDLIDSNGNLKSAAGISMELQDALAGMTNAQQAANLKVLAGTDGFRTLSALYDAGPEKLRKLAQANEEQGTAQEVARKKMDNTAGSLEQLSGALQTLSIKAFQANEGPFRDFIDGATEAVQKFTSIVTSKKLTSHEKITKVMDMISDGIKDAIPKIAGVAAKMGTAILKGIAGAFVQGDMLTRLFIGAAVIRMFGGMKALRGAGTTLGKAMGKGVPGGLVLGIIAATALLAPEAFKLGKKIGEQIKKPLRDVFKWMVDTFGGAADKILGLFSTLIGGVGDIYDKLAGLPVIGGAFKPIADGMHDVEDSINGVRDAMRDIRKFRDDPFGFTKSLLRDNAGDIGKTTQALVSMGISYKRATKLATQAGDDAGASIKRNQQMLDALGGRLGIASGKWDKYGGGVDKATGKADRDVSRHGKGVDSTFDRVINIVGRGADKIDDYASGADKSFGKATGSSGRMAKGIGRNVTSLANGVATGLDAIKDNLNKSLGAFNVKKVAYSIKKAGNVVGNVVGAQHGAIVPGTGSGDKVPLHLDGRLAAMVEPGELVSVANRSATAALMAHNKAVPRRAQGGTVPGATGGLHPSILNLVNSLYSRFGGSVSSGVRAGDTGSLHSTGQAADYVPGNWPAAAAAVNRIGSSLLEGIYDPSDHGGPAVSWDSGSHVPSSFWGSSTWAAHANHIHLAIADGTKAVAGAAVEQIKRVLLKGPDGPLKDMGQAVLDKARAGANAYLKKVMPRVGVEAVGPGANVKNLPSALEKYNHIYAEHNSADGDWGGYRMPFNAVAALAEWAGAPGISMARTAIGESNLRPGATGIDPGGTKGLGLWMITTGFNDGLISKLGGEDAMRNPVLNAQAMNSIFDSQGIGAWYSQTADSSNTHYNGPLLRKFGGLVPHLAKGGKPHHGSFHSGPTDPAFARYEKAKRIADRLKSILGDTGRVARIDERIAGAETLAGLDSSELGSETGPGELAKQIRLNEELLSKLTMARKLARTGLDWTRIPKGMSVDPFTKRKLGGVTKSFNEYLLGLVGLTGQGGRIFDTKVTLDALKHTNTASAAPMDISGLRDVIEASRYGVFDFPSFHTGGIYRAPVGRNEGLAKLKDGERVTPPGAEPHVEINVNFDGYGADVEAIIDGKLAKRERVGHRSARAYSR